MSLLISASPLRHRQLKRLSKQGDRSLNVGWFPQAKADPATLRQDVMRLGLTGRNHLIPHFCREGNIDQMITMDMPDFSAAQTILSPAEAMWLGGHPLPTEDGCRDFFLGSTN